jgi:uncharacterized membrane protein YcjF (UPF0283 family)
MAGIDWLAIIALVISAMVAISQLSKEWRERRALTQKEKQARTENEHNQSLLPIRGANEAVIALQNALKIATDNEDKLRARIVYLEKENSMKDELIDNLEHRVWYCERDLKILKGENPNG